MEYYLLFGRPEVSKAMKAGIARHTVLEEEVCFSVLCYLTFPLFVTLSSFRKLVFFHVGILCNDYDCQVSYPSF